MRCAIRRAVVIGAGAMGAGIAAHLANAGIPTDLLDIIPRELPPRNTPKAGRWSARPSASASSTPDGSAAFRPGRSLFSRRTSPSG